MKCATRAITYVPYSGQSDETPFDVDVLSTAARAVVLAVQSITRAPLDATANVALAIEESARSGRQNAATFEGVPIPVADAVAWAAHLEACKSSRCAR